MDFSILKIAIVISSLLVTGSPDATPLDDQPSSQGKCDFEYDVRVSSKKEIIVNFLNPLKEQLGIELIEVSKGKVDNYKVNVGAKEFVTKELKHGEYYLRLTGTGGCTLIIGSDIYSGIEVK